MDQITCGVFRLGQIWSGLEGDEAAIGLPGRERSVGPADGAARDDRGGWRHIANDRSTHLTSVWPSRG